jgi:hypothetical protein
MPNKSPAHVIRPQLCGACGTSRIIKNDRRLSKTKQDAKLAFSEHMACRELSATRKAQRLLIRALADSNTTEPRERLKENFAGRGHFLMAAPPKRKEADGRSEWKSQKVPASAHILQVHI